MNRRPSWDDVWMSMAEILSKRSHHSKFQVGAVVVTEDNTQVLSVGYNGNYSGGPNKAESESPGESELIHAEMNALFKLDYNNYKNKKMYVTLMPCSMCSKAIINCGIKTVIYKDDYRDSKGIYILKQAGIKIEKYE